MKLECKKNGQVIEIPEGLLSEGTLNAILTLINKHRKHGIFA
jgi:hypothetical protein